MLVQKKTYKSIVKGLEQYRKQNEEDRKENPNLLPCGWGITIRSLIEDRCRENHEYRYISYEYGKELPNLMLEYLVEKGFLVPYAGDYTFPEPFDAISEGRKNT